MGIFTLHIVNHALVYHFGSLLKNVFILDGGDFLAIIGQDQPVVQTIPILNGENQQYQGAKRGSDV